MQLVNQDFVDNSRQTGLFQKCRHLRVDYHHPVLFQVQVDYSPYLRGGEGRQTLEQKRPECEAVLLYADLGLGIALTSVSTMSYSPPYSCKSPNLGCRIWDARKHWREDGALTRRDPGVNVLLKNFLGFERHADTKQEEKPTQQSPGARHFPVTILLNVTNLTL